MIKSTLFYSFLAFVTVIYGLKALYTTKMNKENETEIPYEITENTVYQYDLKTTDAKIGNNAEILLRDNVFKNHIALLNKNKADLYVFATTKLKVADDSSFKPQEYFDVSLFKKLYQPFLNLFKSQMIIAPIIII